MSQRRAKGQDVYVLELPLTNGTVRAIELTEEQYRKFTAELRKAGIPFRKSPYTPEEIIEGLKPEQSK